jgi:hypothetical protein
VVAKGKGDAAMDLDANTIDLTNRAFLREVRSRLESAAGIAKAAEACAEAGNVEKGIEIALDAEQLIYEVNTFLNAASLMNRISKT